MPRTKPMASIEAEIAKTEKGLERARKRADGLAAKLLSLRKRKQDYETKTVMEAFRNSGKSIDELMTFLCV